MKEGTVLATAQAYTNTGHAACSVTAVTGCNRGEDVWVANTQGSVRNVYADVEGINHFTGCKIH